MLTDGLAEGGPALRVSNGLLKSGSRDSQAAGGDVEPFRFEAGHDLLETLAFGASDEVFGGHRKILEMQLAGFDTLIAELIDVAAHRQAGLAFLNHESAHARVGRARLGIGFREK